MISEISKYLPSGGAASGRFSSLKKYGSPHVYPPFSTSASKENVCGNNALQKPIPSYSSNAQLSHLPSTHHHHAAAAADAANHPPHEILNFIEKQEGYIEQLERESQFCRVSF